MRHKNPEYMKEIIDFVDRFYEKHRCFPSCSQIAANTSLQRTAVYNYLVAMNDSGMIEYDGQRILTPFIRSQHTDTRPIGIVGSIACGLPVDSEAQLEDYMNLPVSLVGNDEMYILYAFGSSMIGAGINAGDMVLVKRQETARDGDIIVAYVDGLGNTLKRLKHEGNQIILHPENPDEQDIYVDDVRVQGVAVMVIKDLQNT